MRVMPAPPITKRFAKSRHYFFPYLVKRPTLKAPVAEPREQIEVIKAVMNFV